MKEMNERVNVNRDKLIQQLVDRHCYTKKAAGALIDDFTDIIIYNLRNGDTVSLYGFGNFDIINRKARSCPNPQTGERVHIPEHFIPHFHPGKRMKLAVKMWEDDVNRGLI